MKTTLTTMSLAAIMLGGTALPAMAQDTVDLHFIMCGGEIRPADQVIVDQFMADNPGVTVNFEPVEWGTCQDKSMQLAAAGDPPSLAMAGSRVLRQFSDAGFLRPITFTDEEQALYQDGVLSTVRYGGEYWGVPHAFSTKGLYINCDLVEEAGAECVAPETWDDLIALAKTVTENTDAAGIGIAGKDFDNTMHMFLDFLYSNGGHVYDPETDEPVLDSQQTRETLQLYADLLPYMQSGPIEWERDQLRDLFNDGQIAMYVNGPWGYSQHNEDIKQLVAPVPHGPSGPSGTILITDSLIVFEGTGHEDVAMDLAKTMSSGAAQYELDHSWGLTPIFDYEAIGAEALGVEKIFYVDDPFWKVFVDGISTGGPEPLVQDFKDLQAVFTNMVQGVMLGEGSIDALVTEAGEELAEVE